MTTDYSDPNRNGSEIFSITSSVVTITVTDDKTGQNFTRSLPIDYFENDNGIRLRGENIQGQPVELVFLSSSALDKIRDLTGQGPDEPPHHD